MHTRIVSMLAKDRLGAVRRPIRDDHQFHQVLWVVQAQQVRDLSLENSLFVAHHHNNRDERLKDSCAHRQYPPAATYPQPSQVACVGIADQDYCTPKCPSHCAPLPSSTILIVWNMMRTSRPSDAFLI